MSALQRRMWNGGLGALNSARAVHGLAPLEEALDQPIRADRTLVLTSSSFDFPARELPPGVRYVGPRLDDPGWVSGWTPPPGEDPLVLVGFTTAYQAHEDALRRTAAALSGLPVRAVLTTGPTVDPAEIEAGPNVQVLRSAPHREILERAQLAITHGGHGTTIKALAAGVPVLCMPMGADQADVAARLVASGAGVRIRPRSRPAAIARAAARMLAEPGFSEAAQRMAAAIAADLRQDLAALELESLLRIGSPAEGRPGLMNAAR